MFAIGSLVYSKAQRRVYPARRIVLHGLGDVAVQVQGHRDCRMPKALLRDLRMNSGLE